MVKNGSVLVVVGVRPNFVKAAPVLKALGKTATEVVLLHTKQHHDHGLDEKIWKSLNLPVPNLTIRPASSGVSFAHLMDKLKAIMRDTTPATVVVFGDVTSSLAAAMAASECHIPVIHVEAGLRSFDRTMPEERNRIIIDALSDLLLVPSHDAINNLLIEGKSLNQICLIGNVMIDSLVEHFEDASTRSTWTKFGLEFKEYVLCTLHRRQLSEDPQTLGIILQALSKIDPLLPVILPVHPSLAGEIHRRSEGLPIRLVGALDYVDFLSMQYGAKLVVTDSGGVQEETTFLGVPCVTVRKNTERPITIAMGSNRLGGQTFESIISTCRSQIDASFRHGMIPFWDGNAGERCAQEINRFVRELGAK